MSKIYYLPKRMATQGHIENLITDNIISPTFDLTIDYAELTLDTLISNELIKEIPLVKSIANIVKGGLAVRELFFVKKILTFLKELHSNSLEQNELEHFLEQFDTNTNYKNSVIENIIILNERFIDSKKSIWHGRLFKAHVKQLLSWKDFVSLSHVIDIISIDSADAINILCESDSYGRRYIKNKPPLTTSMCLLLSSGLAFRASQDLIALTLQGLCIYHYCILNEFDKTIIDLNHLAPLEHISKSDRTWWGKTNFK